MLLHLVPGLDAPVCLVHSALAPCFCLLRFDCWWVYVAEAMRSSHSWAQLGCHDLVGAFELRTLAVINIVVLRLIE